jgi:hypothetical protein
MFPTYNTLAEVPEAFREHYVMKGGKAVAEVSTDHPLATNNATLLSEKTQAETRATTAERERDEANRKKGEAESALASANVIPRGQEAVPKADAELVRAVKSAGIESVEAFTTLKTKHDENEVEVKRQERRERLDAIRKAEGWGEGAVDVLELITDLPEIEQRDTSEKNADGTPKKKNVAKVKGADGVVTEKDFSAYFAERHAALLPSVKATKEEGGTELPGHGAGGGGGERSFASEIIKNRYAPKEKAA